MIGRLMEHAHQLELRVVQQLGVHRYRSPTLAAAKEGDRGRLTSDPDGLLPNPRGLQVKVMPPSDHGPGRLQEIM